MPRERVPDVEHGMIEILLGAVRHAELLHHATRSQIGRYGERHDLIEIERLKAKIQSGLCSLGCKPLPPEFRCQSPSYFDARSKRCFPRRSAKANETDERCTTRNFDRPKTEPVRFKVFLDSLNRRVTLLARH